MIMQPTNETGDHAVSISSGLSSQGFAVEMWPIGDVKPYPRNARKISDLALAKVARSIQEFGWRQPIVVDNAGVIVVGHARLLAAQSLGHLEVPVHVAKDLSPAQTRAYRLADNRTNQETDWDEDLLLLELKELQVGDFDLAITGFDVDELDLLFAEDRHGLTDDDAAPDVPETPVSREGDIWTMSGERTLKHRLMCGDATARAHVERLMAGDTADLVFTDPPYNVDYEGYTEQKLKIKGDRLTGEHFQQFLRNTFSSYRAVVKPGASMYVCHSSSWQREFQNALEAADVEVRCQIIWAKNTFAWGFGRYKFQHEPIFYCHLAGQKDPWYGDKTQSTLWQEKKPAANRLHPTMKPVELIERALANSSKAGDIVVDLFGGSGSTLIGCEKTGRQARLMELDPRYVDVIARRWQDYSGKKAHLDADGRTFEEITRERLGNQVS